MKTETCKLYSRDFWIFLPKIIKIDLYNSELYRFKVGAFFETQCISALHTRHNNDCHQQTTSMLQVRSVGYFFLAHSTQVILIGLNKQHQTTGK